MLATEIKTGLIGAAFGCVLSAFVFGGAAWYVQGLKIKAIQTEYNGFVEKTKVIGESVQAKSDSIKTNQIKAKDTANEELQNAFNKLAADNKRLRNARSSTSYTPAASTNTGRADLACFDRGELESAFQFLDGGIQNLVEEGDKNTLRLVAGMKWAKEIQTR